MTPPDYTRELVLHDDRIVRVRPLRATDRAIYERAVMDLSQRSRYLHSSRRYQGSASDSSTK